MPKSRVAPGPGIPEHDTAENAAVNATHNSAAANHSTDNPGLAFHERKRLQKMMDELMHQTSPIGSRRLLEIEAAMNGVDGGDEHQPANEGDGGGYERVPGLSPRLRGASRG